MDESYRKILDDLNQWRSFIDERESLRQMIADARAMIEDAQELNLRLADQRAKLAERFGKPSAATIGKLQEKGATRPPAEDADDGFGKAWPGAEAVLAAAKEKGAELDDGLQALIKYADRMIKSSNQPSVNAAEQQSLARKARRQIKKLARPSDGLVALVYSLSAYLSALLTLRIYERRDDEFRRSLKADGIDDIAKVILGGLADDLAFAGVTHGFVAAMAGFEPPRTRQATSAEHCQEFLKAFKLQLHLWQSGASQHAEIADALLAKEA